MIPFADLHCHTTCSDGTSTPEEILKLAVEKGFKGVSITDHDTVAAYEGLYEKAASYDIELLTGIEFSCHHKTVSVHILGYGFKLDSPPLLELIERHANRRGNRNEAILQKLAQRQMHITYDELKALSGSVVGRPHIALMMVKKGYVGSIQEAFKKYLAEGRPCYASGTVVSVEETIDIIHAAGGKAIIAHPHLLNSPKVLQDLLQMPFDGLESSYANFLADKNRRWKDLAKRKGWLETGGSDYHGSIKPTIAYGASYVDESHFRALQS